jgi:hypothetical protein
MSSEYTYTGLLLCSDLIFTTKIKGTAHALGYNLEIIADVFRAKSAIETLYPRVIFIDLAAGKLSAPESLREYIRLAGPDVWFVAFGSHVEKETLAEAKAAGCQVVLSRSKFAANLPALMQIYYDKRPGESCQAD